MTAGGGAAPARGDERSSPPGRRRAPPGGTTAPCQELADGGPPRSAYGPEGFGDPQGAASSGTTAAQGAKPKARTRRRDENAATARRKAPRARQWARALEGRLRRSARRPPRFRGER